MQATNRSSRLQEVGPLSELRMAMSKKDAEGEWFAARPSGTEDIYKICAESLLGEDHPRRILEEAQIIVGDALMASPQHPGIPVNTNVKEKT